MTATAQFTAQSLFVVYKQLPEEAQHAFKALIAEEQHDEALETGWSVMASETLRDDWDAPENDVWDEFYKKQREQRGELSAG